MQNTGDGINDELRIWRNVVISTGMETFRFISDDLAGPFGVGGMDSTLGKRCTWL